MSRRVRTKYTDRNRQYALRDSEINTLGEVGKFRVARMSDLAEFAYNGDLARAKNDAENLERQSLAKQTTIADPEHNPTQVVTPTKEGHKLLSRGKVVERRGRFCRRAQGTALSLGQHPNELWYTDYKGEFLLENRQYCYPLTVTESCQPLSLHL